MDRRSRSEVELFNALPETDDPETLNEFRTRIRKCVFWLIARRPSGELVLGDVPDMIEEVVSRLETHLRPPGRKGFDGTNEQFRRYLYRTVSSVYADTVNLRVRLQSLDTPIVRWDGELRTVGKVLDDLIEWPTVGDDLERRDVQAGVRHALERIPERCRRWLLAFHRDDIPIKEIAGQEGVRVNNVEVGLLRCRGYFRLAFLDAFLAAGDDEFKQRVTGASHQLSGPHAMVFRAYWADGRSVAETAKLLGFDQDKVKTLLTEAKEQIWRALREGGPA